MKWKVKLTEWKAFSLWNENEIKSKIQKMAVVYVCSSIPAWFGTKLAETVTTAQVGW